MSDARAEVQETELVLTFAVDAPPEKVRRAIETPELRALWLPGCTPADAEPLPAISGGDLRFRLRDDGGAPVETAVTFRIEPGANGGTLLTVTHEIPKARVRGPAAANDDRRTLMRAA